MLKLSMSDAVVDNPLEGCTGIVIELNADCESHQSVLTYQRLVQTIFLPGETVIRLNEEKCRNTLQLVFSSVVLTDGARHTAAPAAGNCECGVSARHATSRCQGLAGLRTLEPGRTAAAFARRPN